MSVIYTRWSFKGEQVKEKLSGHEHQFGLLHVGQRKGKEIYEMDLNDFPQYQKLEKLCEELSLDISIISNAEWLAVLYTNYKNESQ